MNNELNWIVTDEGYEIAILDGKLKSKNNKGKILSAVPKKVKETDKAKELLALCDWLIEHEIECLEYVDSWMLKSFPIPLDLLTEVWKDQSWQKYLKNLIWSASDDSGKMNGDGIGFLKNIDANQGVGIVNIDGETQWLKDDLFCLPHPILLEDLEDFRELATELDIQQGCQQLMRETFSISSEDLDKKEVSKYASGEFEMLRHAISRTRKHGYRVSGGFAVCPLFENNVQSTANFWIGADDPEYEAETGELIWIDEKQKTLELKELGPVTFSEGMRMAATIYAGRKIEKEGS